MHCFKTHDYQFCYYRAVSDLQQGTQLCGGGWASSLYYRGAIDYQNVLVTGLLSFQSIT